LPEWPIYAVFEHYFIEMCVKLRLLGSVLLKLKDEHA